MTGMKSMCYLFDCLLTAIILSKMVVCSYTELYAIVVSDVVTHIIKTVPGLFLNQHKNTNSNGP